MQVRKHRALALFAVLAIAACSGDKGSKGDTGATGDPGAPGTKGDTGATGPAGANGQDLTATAQPESCLVCHGGAGLEHQALYNSFADGINPATTKLAAQIVSVATSAGTNANTYKSTVTFTLKKSGVPLTTGTTLKQKTMYFVSYDATAKNFPTAPYNQDASVDPTGETGGQPASAVNFSYGSITLTDAATGTYTMVKDNLPADPLTAANSFVYGYFGDAVLNIPVKPTTHYTLMDNMVSVAKVLTGSIDYSSTANVSACENCHGKPYSKHGYRQAAVAGLPDFAACKACHTDQRRGTDGGWYLLVDDPATYAAQGNTLVGTAQKLKYFYTANVMNDTHNSHAFEFAYPQSMANCATCHAGKLDRILTDANFKLTTCRSCHPVTGVGGTDAKRAPALLDILPASIHGSMDLYASEATATTCNMCHSSAVRVGKTFAQIHTGYNSAIYDANGAPYASSIKTQVDSATFDSTTNKLTVNFSVTGAAANAVIKPTVVMSLYGYESKDFIVTGHGSASDGKRNLEWTEGSSSNSARLTVAPGAAAASWTATADLTLWASRLADGSVKKLEIGVLPALGLNQTVAVQSDATKPGYNPMLAISGITKTFDLANNALMADGAVYGKAIVDTAKCNKCHDALGTTFHGPNYGSASVVGCRLCHVGLSGGSHLEMQSRSIDSYVHAIHTFQAFDIGGIDFSNPVSALEYGEHIDATYPNFTILNCESCHNAGTYEVPDQSKSMPGILSKAATIQGKEREIGVVPSYVTGPASRACGSCHRAEMINEDAAGELAAFNGHTETNGYMIENATGVLDAAIAKIMSLFQ